MDHLREQIIKLREDFTKGTLNETDVNENPALQFEKWLAQAVEAKIPEVQAMTLATVSEDGKPASRIVYLREFEHNQFWFYGNYNSKKAKHMEKNPNISLSFFWPELERQIRIEGTVIKCHPSNSDAYYNNRPYESKIGSWASNQSGELTSRDELINKVEELKKQFTPETIKRPEFWGGWILKASYYEFWQGRKSRLHDRIVYSLENNVWKIKRLAP
ncbi:MAG: pyridoxamine 5'-phosphate oxidase [Sphingobacteriaceae bacterium]|jgi:pyridoxamine 5'-phosphate oxidase